MVRGRGKPSEAQEHIFKATPSKVKGHPEVKLPLKCPMAIKIDRKNPDQSVLHCWGKRSCRVNQVKLLINAMWIPNLIGTTPEESVMHCWDWSHARVNL